VHTHSPTRERCTQRHAFNELRRNEVPVPFRADFVDRQNIRMIKSRGSARLAFETAQLTVVRRQSLWEKLKRHFTPESLVSCQVHLAHSAHTNERFDPIMSDRFTHYRAGPVIGQKFGANLEDRSLDKLC